MTQGLRTADVKFTVAKGPADRWFVEDFELIQLQNKGFCKKGQADERVARRAALTTSLVFR